MEAYLWWVQKLLYIALFVMLTLMVRDACRRGDMWKATAHELLKLNCVERELREGLNPHAHLLGKIVEARVYEASDWERMVVVAVSWKGGVCVRYASDPDGRGRWIKKQLVPYRVREVANG